MGLLGCIFGFIIGLVIVAECRRTSPSKRDQAQMKQMDDLRSMVAKRKAAKNAPPVQSPRRVTFTQNRQ